MAISFEITTLILCNNRLIRNYFQPEKQLIQPSKIVKKIFLLFFLHDVKKKAFQKFQGKTSLPKLTKEFAPMKVIKSYT